MGSSTTAKALRKAGDGMEATIQKKLNPAVAGQNWTRRRAGQIESMRKDAEHLQRIQKVCFDLADMHERDSIPFDVCEIKTKNVIETIIYWDRFPAILVDDHPHMAVRKEGIRKDFTKAGVFASNYLKVRATIMDLAELSDAVRIEREKRSRADEIRGMVGKIPGYFPTPQPVIDLMFEACPYQPGKFGSFLQILEPSAGDGAIARATRERWSEAKLKCVEFNYTLAAHLRDQGFDTIQDDFMELPVEGLEADLILMNPPFEKGQDIEHVIKAFRCLKDGGQLVAIMSPSAFFVKNTKAENFRNWFNVVEGTKFDLPQGSFEKSGTGVGAVLVTIHKNSK